MSTTRMPRLDDEVVCGLPDVGQCHLTDVDPEGARTVRCAAVRARHLDDDPGQLSGLSGSLVGQCIAIRGSRRTSRNFIDPGIMPSTISPSLNAASLPLIRGEPSRRTVAMILLVPASKRAFTLAANSAASSSISCQRAMPDTVGNRYDNSAAVLDR